MIYTFLRYLLVFFGRYVLSKLFFKLTITGRQHLPQDGPLIIITNHFSWFEAPLIILHLPYKVSFLAATELQRFRLFRLLMPIFDLIPIWRGQVDRAALRRARQTLDQGGVIGILPEGGVNPELQALVASGQPINEVEGHTSRPSAQLIKARPGAAYLAVHSQAAILPVAFLGTEQILQNVKRLRRTPVTLHIGPAFGPLTLEKGVHGPARRQRLGKLGDLMMAHIAALLPPENRGPYA